MARELDRMLKSSGIEVEKLPEQEFDNPLGVSTGAGVIFGTTGGVMEAALRTAAYFVTGKNILLMFPHSAETGITSGLYCGGILRSAFLKTKFGG